MARRFAHHFVFLGDDLLRPYVPINPLAEAYANME
jgi:hypothetical protein